MILNKPYDYCKRLISPFVESQFPLLFKNEGQRLIEFVTAYYEFEEQTAYQFLNVSSCMTDKDDIDTTLDEFVVFFKSKYMRDLPFDNSTTNRFLVKHILDLYRSKGTERSLKLLMQIMFGEEDAQVYYPDRDVLRPSHSIWHQPRYIEVAHSDKARQLIGKKVVGSISKATAFVDNVITKNIGGNLIDVIYLDNQRGQFTTGDYIAANSSVFEFPQMTGSLTTIEVTNGGSGFAVGDLFDIKSSYGDLGVAKTDTITTADNKVYFDIKDSGFGYQPTAYADGNKVPNSLTKIIVSDLVLRISNSGLKDGDQLFDSASNLIGTVMEADESNVWLYGTAGPSAWEGLAGNTVKDAAGTVFNVTRVYKGSGATFEIISTSNNETVFAYTDIIGDLNINGVPYPNVLLSDGDYFFPATIVPAELSTTVLQDAFQGVSITLGSVNQLALINNGSGYDVDVRVKVVSDLIAQANYNDVIITFPADTSLNVGDTITQASTEAKGVVLSVSGNTAIVRPTKFGYYFKNNSTAINSTTNKSFAITSVAFDPNSLPMGANLVISADTRIEAGQVGTMSIIASGYGFRNGDVVTMTSRRTGATITGVAKLGNSGLSEGIWKTTSSHLNWSTYIHDNDYYQEYSYEVTSSRPVSAYSDVVRNVTHVAGTKMFGRVEKVTEFEMTYGFASCISNTDFVECTDSLEIF